MPVIRMLVLSQGAAASKCGCASDEREADRSRQQHDEGRVDDGVINLNLMKNTVATVS